MQKILKSLLTVGVVAVVVAGSAAYFSDTETSTGNTFQAGAIDLRIDNESYYNGQASDTTSWDIADLDDGQGPADGKYLFFNFWDLKPGDWGEDTISLHVTDNPAWACMDLTLTANDDYSSNEPELKVEGEVGEDGGDNFDGELAQGLEMLWWADDGNNIFEDGETILYEGTLADMVGDENTVRVALADASGNAWGEDGPMVSFEDDKEVVHYVAKAWCLGDLEIDYQTPNGVTCDGSESGNVTQTDKVMADVSFYAVQSRHNEDFVCNPSRVTVNEGDWDASEGGQVRFRSFANTGGQELYLGYNTGSSTYRLAQEFSWSKPGSHPVSFSYDAGDDELTAVLGVNSPLVYTNFSSVAGCPVGDWDVMRFTIANRDTGTTVDFKNVDLSGNALGDFSGGVGNSGWHNWTVTGFDFGSGFTLTGDVDLDGTFSTSQENSKLEVSVGCM